MEHIYYADRPSVPSTQHNIVHLSSILEHSLLVNLEDIHQPFYADVVEVKDEQGEVRGTLLWVGGVTYEQLVANEETENDPTYDDTDTDAVTDADAGAEADAEADAIIALNERIDEQAKYIDELETALSKRMTDGLH